MGLYRSPLSLTTLEELSVKYISITLKSSRNFKKFRLFYSFACRLVTATLQTIAISARAAVRQAVGRIII